MRVSAWLDPDSNQGHHDFSRGSKCLYHSPNACNGAGLATESYEIDVQLHSFLAGLGTEMRVGA